MKNNVTNNQQNNTGEQDIDIIAVLVKLWNSKSFIIKTTLIFFVLGLFIAIFSPKVYTSSCTFVPQTSKKSAGGGLSSLAALAGISLGDMSSGDALSPMVYPQILENVDFRKELMYSKIKFKDFDEPISIIDYYTNPVYAKFNLIAFLKKYTIGLPGLILNAIRPPEDKIKLTDGDKIRYYTVDEYNCTRILSETIGIQLEEKAGYLTISCKIGEPLAAAQLCQITFDLLQKYITDFKISKVQNQLDFIKKRYIETKCDYEDKQNKLAQFIDANKVISSAQARLEQERLTSEAAIANTVYTEMTKQLLQAEIQVKEDTPILTSVKPVAIPFKKSEPKTFIILLFCIFIGLALSSALVMSCYWLEEQGYSNDMIRRIIGE